jgi:hypothetical protein
MQTDCEAEQLTLFGPDLWCGKTSPEPSPRQTERTSGRSSKKPSELRTTDFQFLDLRPGGGNLLGPCWETNAPLLGEYWTLNTGASPKDAVESSLSRILQATVPRQYYLSRTACLGILRRAEERGKDLPAQLEAALELQAGITELPIVPAPSQNGSRNVAGFCAGAGPSAGTIGYQEERAPTLKASASGNMMPSILCLNDQGGQRMDLSLDRTGTLRADEKGHQPLVYENHGIDARYSGPHKVAPTMSARYGTGGNNIPLVSREPDTICITGNAIDRQPQNGGNGLGWQADLSYTLTATDHHAVFNRQRVDQFVEQDVASTESARQHKDATDLICQPDTEQRQLIRRLTPLECERLQGFPDGWTEIPGASDSARYKSLGNSVAIPCVIFVLRGIASVLRAAGSG